MGEEVYQLSCTIKCPGSERARLLEAACAQGGQGLSMEEVPYARFVAESRLYWDYVFPQMLADGKPVTYITFSYPDTPEGREACHRAEWAIGWVPLNVRYEEV